MATVTEGGPGIPYSYTLEMRPGPDGGSGGYGFELPAEYFILFYLAHFLITKSNLFLLQSNYSQQLGSLGRNQSSG
jgi:hypothetical protein